MKRFTLYFLLGAVSGMFIVPALLAWLGIPSLGQWLNTLSGATYVTAMVVMGVVFLSVTIWLIKMAKEAKKESRSRS